jgi:hypothetical protein
MLFSGSECRGKWKDMIRIRFRTGIQNNQIRILFSNRYPEHPDTRSFQTSIQSIDTRTKVDAD